MSFFKKLGQVAADTANVIQKKSSELKTVYEKDKLSGLMSVAEKNLESLSVATSDYLDNLKKVNETVITETAKNANSSFEAIWRSTFAVSKETLTYVSRDLKNQALKLYKAWEDVEVEKVMSPEMKLLFDATKVVSPSTLMIFCNAQKEGAVYSLNGIQVEIYGEIWISPSSPDKQNKGSMSLLQHIIVNSTKENMTDEFLLRQCLSMMYKIPNVRQEYERTYADYLAQNPEVTPIKTPFDEREVKSQEGSTESDNTANVVESVKVGAKQAFEKSVKGVEVISQKVKDASAQATKDIKEAWNNKGEVDAVSQVEVSETNQKVEELSAEVESLRKQLAQAKESTEVKKPEEVKTPTKRVTKKVVDGESVKKPVAKKVTKKTSETSDTGVVKKPAVKVVRKKPETKNNVTE